MGRWRKEEEEEEKDHAMGKEGKGEGGVENTDKAIVGWRRRRSRIMHWKRRRGRERWRIQTKIYWRRSKY